MKIKKNAPKEADINFDIEGNLLNSLYEKCEIKKKNLQLSDFFSFKGNGGISLF
jgi:hypothetical protein